MKAGLAGFVGLVALLHLLRADDLPPADHFISEYARGDPGWIMVLAFWSWAVSLALLASRWRGAMRVLLAIAAAGAFFAGCFATQTVAGVLPEGVQRTTTGRLHDIATLGIFVGALLAAIWSTRVVRRRGYRLAVLGLAVALFAIVPVLVALGLDAPGIGQRGFVLVGVVWQVLATREVARDGAATREAA